MLHTVLLPHVLEDTVAFLKVHCNCAAEEIPTSAVQLHFIMCPFPNQIQFGLEKNPQIIGKLFQTKSSLVWKIIVSNLEGN